MFNMRFDLPEIFSYYNFNPLSVDSLESTHLDIPQSIIIVDESETKAAQEEVSYEYLPGYNTEAGEKLANVVEANTTRVINEETNRFIKGKTKPASQSTSNCCRYVKSALLATSMMEYQWVNACDMDTRLRKDPNFREIDLSLVDDPTKLPPGCILVYETNAGYSRQYGHIAVTLGDGRTASDLVENHPRKTVGSAFYYVGPESKTFEFVA